MSDASLATKASYSAVAIATNLVDLRGVEADAEAEPPRLERHEADARLDVDADDLLGGLRRHLLDVHAARRARHHQRLARRAIQHEAQVHLAGDLHARFNQDPLHQAARFAGLARDEGHADHLARERLGFVPRLGELHAAALAAAARVDLRLDDDQAAAKAAGDLARFDRRERHFPARHGNAVTREDRFGLVLVNSHLSGPLFLVPGSWFLAWSLFLRH